MSTIAFMATELKGKQILGINNQILDINSKFKSYTQMNL